MTRALAVVLSTLALLACGCSLGPPTPEQLKQMAIGQWAANPSAMASATRARKLSNWNAVIFSLKKQS